MGLTPQGTHLITTAELRLQIYRYLTKDASAKLGRGPVKQSLLLSVPTLAPLQLVMIRGALAQLIINQGLTRNQNFRVTTSATLRAQHVRAALSNPDSKEIRNVGPASSWPPNPKKTTEPSLVPTPGLHVPRTAAPPGTHLLPLSQVFNRSLLPAVAVLMTRLPALSRQREDKRYMGPFRILPSMLLLHKYMSPVGAPLLP